MKNAIMKSLLLACLCVVGTQAVSCKKKSEPVVNSTVETPVATQDTTTAAPVVIAPDEKLQTDVKDAIKDFPTVTVAVADGEITLTGNITRDRLTTLMQSLHALQPKKINNNLTITK